MGSILSLGLSSDPKLVTDGGGDPEFEGYLSVHERHHPNASQYQLLKEDATSMIYNLDSTQTKRPPTLKEFRNSWYFNTQKQTLFEVRAGLRLTDKSQSILAFGDLNNDIYSDMIAVRSDSLFAIYLFDPDNHKFIDLNTDFDAGCPIESINIASSPSSPVSIFIKCNGGDSSLLKTFAFSYSNDNDKWGLRELNLK